MKEAYTHLAQFYDQLMDEDYSTWTDYLLCLAAKQGLEPKRILDLGCGTGSMAAELAGRGFEVLGIDISPAMIRYAREKARRLGLPVQFQVQDMRELYLPHQQWDLVVAACDALNYLTTPEDFRRTVEAVYTHLVPGGLFLFDLNSASKLQDVYGNNSYADLFDNFAYFWDNHFDAAEQTCTMNLTFFLPGPGETYRRVEERHVQKLWYPHQVEGFLADAGFELVGYYGFLTLEPPADDAHRWQFSARKALQ